MVFVAPGSTFAMRVLRLLLLLLPLLDARWWQRCRLKLRGSSCQRAVQLLRQLLRKMLVLLLSPLQIGQICLLPMPVIVERHG